MAKDLTKTLQEIQDCDSVCDLLFKVDILYDLLPSCEQEEKNYSKDIEELLSEESQIVSICKHRIIELGGSFPDYFPFPTTLEALRKTYH